MSLLPLCQVPYELQVIDNGDYAIDYVNQLAREERRRSFTIMLLDLRGYPKTFSHCHSKIKQHPCGNETQDDRRERAYSA